MGCVAKINLLFIVLVFLFKNTNSTPLLEKLDEMKETITDAATFEEPSMFSKFLQKMQKGGEHVKERFGEMMEHTKDFISTNTEKLFK